MEIPELAAAFRMQARGCADHGSPIYAALLERAADDVEAGGAIAELFADWQGEPLLHAVSLRMLGAVHALVLAGEAPALAAYYPSAGGRFEPEGAWRALLDVVARRRDFVRARLDEQLQTNAVGRSAALLPGFLRIARETDLPLRLLEIGSSAGLNLVFDRYRYALGPHRWGDPAAELELATDWRGPPPDLDALLRVASRAGCDLAPIDVADPAQRLRLQSFVWPEHGDRLAELASALEIAAAEPPPVERARAGDWIAERLAGELPRGAVTVLFQSTMWWYLPEAERERVTTTVHAAGARAGEEAPLAWLRFEPPDLGHAEVRLTLWPGGADRLLARAQHHGRWVQWETP